MCGICYSSYYIETSSVGVVWCVVCSVQCVVFSICVVYALYPTILRLAVPVILPDRITQCSTSQRLTLRPIVAGLFKFRTGCPKFDIPKHKVANFPFIVTKLLAVYRTTSK